MKIYKLDREEVWQKILKFFSTYYGKIVFTLAYSLFFIFILITIILIILTLTYHIKEFMPLIFAFSVSSLVSFVLGSRYYYNKLEEYINNG